MRIIQVNLLVIILEKRICWTVSFESSQHYNFRYHEIMKMVEKTNGIIPEAQKQIVQKVGIYTWGFETNS